MQVLQKSAWRLNVFALLMLALCVNPANAQVQEVVVGVTIGCPYENAIEGSCWSGAYAALMELEGVKSVDKSANGYNCTARVYLKNQSLPDPDKWAQQFKKLVDQSYNFRGIEVSVKGTIEQSDGKLILRVPGIEQSIALDQFEHKLQWNSKKKTARQPEPDERDAYKLLMSQIAESTSKDSTAVVIGPLRKTDHGFSLEVREFYMQAKR